MYIFLDESGKPEVFSAKGNNLVKHGTASKYLVIAAVKTSDHLTLQDSVNSFKSSLLSRSEIRSELSAAYALDSFHANKDKETIRLEFYKHIAHLKDIEVHVIVANKLRVQKQLQENPSQFYGLMAGLILQGISHQDTEAQIIFSRQDNGKKIKQQLELEVERIREFFWTQHREPPTGIELNYQHNPHYSHAGLQVADYIAFAVFKFYEHQNPTYLKMIQPRIRHIYHFTNKQHFTRSRPLKLS